MKASVRVEQCPALLRQCWQVRRSHCSRTWSRRLRTQKLKWSASRLESYRTCAFQFFGRYGLDLVRTGRRDDRARRRHPGQGRPRSLGIRPRPRCVTRKLPLDPDNLDEVLERLREQGRTIWNAAPSKYGFGSVHTWGLDWQSTLDRLRADAYQ